MKIFHHSVLLISAFQFVSFSAFPQGPLTPPSGTPGPSFKTLHQVEPRIDLNSAAEPYVTTSDPNYQFIINYPGSYYLSADTFVTKPNGIKIATVDVTLDLNGFRVWTFFGSTTGIEVTGQSSVRIHHGSVYGFAYGVGMDGNSHACAVRDLTVSFCTFRPIILAGSGALIDGCLLQNNSGESGIIAGNGATISNCTVFNNTLSVAGIYANSGSNLINCTLNSNTAVYGIYADGGCSLTNCTATGNTVTYGVYARRSSLSNCSAAGNTSNASNSGGFQIDYSTAINCTAYGNNSTGTGGPTAGFGFGSNSVQFQGCSAMYNRGHGFWVSDSALTNCISQNNGTSSQGFGVMGGQGSTIVNSTVTTNSTYGIFLNDGGAVLNCTVRGTTGGGIGIRVADKATVSGCTVNDNLGDGIQFINRCAIVNNTVANNGTGTSFDGIHSFGNDNRIDGNTSQSNKAAGIRASATDIVVRNSAHNNGTNYIPASGTNIGPVGVPSTATSPWANF